MAKYATEFIFYTSLISQADPTDFQNNPTLAAGDVKVSTDGAAEANLGTLPVVTPASSRHVKVTVSAAEMTGKAIHIFFRDAAGAEWMAKDFTIFTSDHQSAQEPNGVLRKFTAAAGSTTTFTVDTGGSTTDSAYRGAFFIVDSGAGSGQFGFVSAYVGATKVATVVETLGTALDATSVIILYAGVPMLRFLTGDSYAAVIALRPKKNTAFAKFPFKMVLSSDHITPATGKTVTVQRSLDGAAFANAANTPATEVSGGWYYIDLAAGDLNANSIALKMTAAATDQVDMLIITQP